MDGLEARVGLMTGSARKLGVRHETGVPFHRPPLMSNIPAAALSMVAAVLALAVGIPLRYLDTAHQVEPAPPPPSPPQIEARIQGEGYDQQQRRLPFTVYVLSQELTWKLESVTDLEGQGTLLSPELTDALNRARDVLCVGTASFEGATTKEEARAAERARNLAQWVGSAIRDPQQARVFAVSAGQYRGPVEVRSANQRKAIIIITEGHADDVDLHEALSAGLRKKQEEYPIVYSLLHEYSRSGDWLTGLSRQ